MVGHGICQAELWGGGSGGKVEKGRYGMALEDYRRHANAIHRSSKLGALLEERTRVARSEVQQGGGGGSRSVTYTSPFCSA